MLDEDNPRRKRSIRVTLAEGGKPAIIPIWSIRWMTAPTNSGRPPHSPAKSLIFVRGYSTGFGVMETLEKLEELLEG